MGSELIEVIRPYWAPGLVAVPKITIKGFAAWVSMQRYQIHDRIETGKATLHFLDLQEPVEALAYDLNRFASAAFETTAGMTRTGVLPRSGAWLCVQAYYGAYYAGHALVRSLGRTYSRLDSQEVNALNTIIDLFGMSNGTMLPTATYSGFVEPAVRSFAISRVQDAQGGASHAGFWRFFLNEIRTLRDRILGGPGLTAQNQRAGVKLDELCDALCRNGYNNGGWLSSVRNGISYRHQHGCWYPYDYRRQYADRLYALIPKWKRDTYSFDLAPNRPADLVYFLTTCFFVIAICRELVESILERRTVSHVFVEDGCLRLLSLVTN